MQSFGYYHCAPKDFSPEIKKRLIEKKVENRHKLSAFYYYKKHYLDRLTYLSFSKDFVMQLNSLFGDVVFPKFYTSEGFYRDSFSLVKQGEDFKLTYYDREGQSWAIPIAEVPGLAKKLNKVSDEEDLSKDLLQAVKKIIYSHHHEKLSARFEKFPKVKQALFGGSGGDSSDRRSQIGMINRIADLQMDENLSGAEKMTGMLESVLAVYQSSSEVVDGKMLKQSSRKEQTDLKKLQSIAGKTASDIFNCKSEHLRITSDDIRSKIFLTEFLRKEYKNYLQSYQKGWHLARRKEQVKQILDSINHEMEVIDEGADSNNLEKPTDQTSVLLPQSEEYTDSGSEEFDQKEKAQESDEDVVKEDLSQTPRLDNRNSFYDARSMRPDIESTRPDVQSTQAMKNITNIAKQHYLIMLQLKQEQAKINELGAFILFHPSLWGCKPNKIQHKLSNYTQIFKFHGKQSAIIAAGLELAKQQARQELQFQHAIRCY